ncbi:MAG TPA: ATP-dependent Clp protease adaptor ClpS [Phycisphaerae bacterium]|nr:ATP-dependent Clp protease adaptor ClpS [Phycisphaerae bacterium]
MDASEGAVAVEVERREEVGEVVGDEVRPEVKGEAEKAPRYAVVLHNDPINGFEWVVEVLMRVLGCGRGQAYQWTLRAHECGRAAVWSGSLEVAELKAEQLRGVGPDPGTAWRAGARALGVTVERV